MQHLRQNLRNVLLPALVMSPLLGACSMDRLADMTPTTSGFTNFEWNPYSKASMVSLPPLTRGRVTAADFVNPDGSCAGAAPEAESEQPRAAIALQMTECAVVLTLGMPEKIDIAANERGERSATLLYSRGERPGLYYFTAGQLTLIERVAEPAPPPKQKPAAKPRRTAT